MCALRNAVGDMARAGGMGLVGKMLADRKDRSNKRKNENRKMSEMTSASQGGGRSTAMMNDNKAQNKSNGAY